MKVLVFAAVCFTSVLAQAQLMISPSQINFYRTPVNSSDWRSARVTNYSNREVQVYVNDTCFDFDVRESFCWSLRPHQSCNIDVTFRPRRAGHYSCHVNVSSNMGGGGTLWITGDAYDPRNLYQ